MSIQTAYTTGTIAINNGETTVTGNGTAWLGVIQPGWMLMVGVTRMAQVVSVESDTQLTIAPAWSGGNLSTSAYRIVTMSDAGDLLLTTRQLIRQISEGNLPAFAGLQGATNNLMYFAAGGAMALTPFTSAARQLLDDTSFANMRNTLGATDVGNALFTAASLAAGRNALGLGSAAVQEYETGSFLPTLLGGTTAGVPSYNNQGGTYVRVGNVVFVHVYMVTTSLTGAAGTITVGGLPFVRAGGNTRRSTVPIAFWGGLTLPAGSIHLTGFMIAASNEFGLYRWTTTSGALALDVSAITGSQTIYCSFAYEI